MAYVAVTYRVVGIDLDERLEALTHSVELLAAIHKDNEREMKRLGKYVRSVTQIVLDHEIRIRSLEGDEGEDDDNSQQHSE